MNGAMLVVAFGGSRPTLESIRDPPSSTPMTVYRKLIVTFCGSSDNIHALFSERGNLPCQYLIKELRRAAPSVAVS